MLSEEEIIKTISVKTNVPENEIVERVNVKESEFSGLVSRLGAAYIVGKELGINLVTPISKELKIKNIISGMKNVNFIGKIVGFTPVREFETDRGRGKVVNIIFADESGSIRLSLWNEKTDVVENLKVGDVLEVIGGYTRMDSFGNPEVRLSKYGNMRKLEMDIKAIEPQKKITEGYKKVFLNSLEEDEFIDVKGTILQIFERGMIYSVCSICKNKIEDSNCKQHGKVEAEKMLVLSGVIDDGYGAANIVFFRKVAESLLGESTTKIAEKIQMHGLRGFIDSLDIFGESFRITGVVRKNELTGNLEIVAHNVKKLDVQNEIKNLLGGLN